jgi:hypothetical protein
MNIPIQIPNQTSPIEVVRLSNVPLLLGSSSSVTVGTTVVLTDNIFKWDSTNDYYRPYSIKSESSIPNINNKFYYGNLKPDVTTRLTYNGIFGSYNIKEYGSNIVLGSGAGILIDELQATNNTIIGQGSATSLTVGDSNIVIGNYSGGLMESSTGNIIIGDNLANSETGSNKLYIRSLITGDFQAATLSLNGSVTFGGSLNLESENAKIWHDSNNEITFTDPINGTKKLSELLPISGLVPTDNIFKFDNTYYRPYLSRTEAGGNSSGGKFWSDVSSPAPSSTTNHLTYNGIYLCTGITVTDVGVVPTLISGNTTITDTLLINHPSTNSTFPLEIKVDSTSYSTLNPNVVDSSSAVAYKFYTKHTLNTTGAKVASFKSYTSEPLYIDSVGVKVGLGMVDYPYSLSSPLIVSDSINGSVFDSSGDVSPIVINRRGVRTTNPYGSLLSITNQFSGDVDSSVDLISITDIPTNTGTKIGSSLKVYCDVVDNSHLRIELNPRVIDTGGNTAYKFDTVNSLSQAYRSLFYNNGSNPIIFTHEGSIDIPSGSEYRIGGIPISTGFSTTLISDVLKFNANTYTPYIDKVDAGGISSFGKFYLDTANPTASTRLNYDGYLWATSFNSTNGFFIGQAGSNISLNNLGQYSSVISSVERTRLQPGITSANGSIAYSFDTSTNQTVSGSLLAQFSNYSVPKFTIDKDGNVNIPTGATYQINGIALSTGSTPSADILNWSSNKYTPYSSATTNTIYLGTTNPSSTTRLNLDYSLFPTSINLGNNITAYGASTSYPLVVSSTGYGSILNCKGNDNVLFLEASGSQTGTNTSSEISIQRTISGSTNLTGPNINILDNPTNSGTRDYKTFSAIIGTTERISLNPRVPDGASAIAYNLDTHNSLSTLGTKLLSIKNSGIEKFYIDYDGYLALNQGLYAGTLDIVSGTDFSLVSKTGITIRANDTNRLVLTPSVNDGATALPYIFDTKNALSTSGAKLLSIKNNGTEKFYIDKDGEAYANGTHLGAIGYTAENVANKVTAFQVTPDDTHYPSEKLVADQLTSKQATLVSGTNIKTINTQSIVGSGNITIGANVTGIDGNIVIISGNQGVDSGLPYALILAGL